MVRFLIYYIGRLKKNLRDFFEVGRDSSCGVRVAGSEFRVAGPSIANLGFRILDWNLMDYELRGTGCVLRVADING